MGELIRREDVQREIQASFDGGAFRWQDGQDLLDRINALPTASPWRRVEEEPVPYKWVWGVYSQTVCGKTFRHHKTVRNDGDHIIDEDWNIYDGFITHWMYRWPLPEPPKEENDG